MRILKFRNALNITIIFVFAILNVRLLHETFKFFNVVAEIEESVPQKSSWMIATGLSVLYEHASLSCGFNNAPPPRAFQPNQRPETENLSD